jgi:hypothetical protein
MKNYILFVLIISGNIVFGNVKWEPPYIIVSDKLDTSIAKGYFVLEGTLTNGSSTINEAYISAPSGRWVQSGKTGKFKIQLSLTDSIIIIKKLGFHNIFVSPYGSNWNQHHIVISAEMINETPTINPNAYPVSFKPVIYAYSDKSLQFDLTINPTGKFSFTYPQINENNTCVGMQIDTNGKLTDNKGKQFPYLFWESINEPFAFAHKKEHSKWAGSLVDQKDILAFLENKLTELGLTSIEQTDFITYWGPRMTHYSSCFVQFLVDEEYDQVAAMKCTPAPQNCRRVYLLFTGMDNASAQAQMIKQNAVEQHFTSFDRSGFTLLEWGGSELEMDDWKM